MPQSQQEFDDLIARVRRGSPEATRELVERFGPHILRIVRRKLHRRLRPKFDSDDFQQAVWASFFAVPRHEFNFDRPEALVSYLTQLALNKVTEEYRHRCQAGKHNVYRECSLDDSVAGRKERLPGRLPTPSQVAVANEQWDQLQRGLTPEQRLVLVLLRQGCTQVEIAREVGVSERTVRRLIQELAPGSDS
jgi:RNA polymerase sigma factor (sigma-70 family)